MRKRSSSRVTWISAMKNRKEGHIYEQAFFTQALRKNLEVFIPLGDYLPQDCLIMNQAGKVFKVQIKGSKVERNRYKISSSSGSGTKRSLDCTKVDILAAYCVEPDVFYLIPCMELDGSLTIGLCPQNPNSKAKFEKFKDNWSVFKTT